VKGLVVQMGIAVWLHLHWQLIGTLLFFVEGGLGVLGQLGWHKAGDLGSNLGKLVNRFFPNLQAPQPPQPLS